MCCYTFYMQWDTASLESRSQIFLGRYRSPTPDARWLPREERNSSEESLIFIWLFNNTNIDFIKQKEDQIIALVCMLNSAWNTLPVSMCCPRRAFLIACVISEEVICGLVSVNGLCSFIIVLLGCSSLSLRTQPAPHCCVLSFWPGSLENLSASRTSRQSTKLPWRQGTRSLFSGSSSLLSQDKKLSFSCMVKSIIKPFPGTNSADAVLCLFVHR